MKRLFVIILMLLCFCGCDGENRELNRALAIRDRLENSGGCSFDAVVTADYSDKVYTFSMKCKTDATGNLSFTVMDPGSISGIGGLIGKDGGKLTFHDTILAFEMMAEGQISPVTAPWLFIQTLRSGYIHACGAEGDGILIAIDDSYEGETLQLEVWTDKNDTPVRGEIIWNGRRILTVDVRNFVLL